MRFVRGFGFVEDGRKLVCRREVSFFFVFN